MTLRTLASFVLCAAALVAQQSNTGNHSMTINGVDGPPFPILTNNVRTSLPANFQINGAGNQPYAIFQGNLAAGTLLTPAGIVDLALSPPPALVIDGYQNPAFRTDATGLGYFSVQVPNVGTFPTGVPLGFQVSLQALMGDPFNFPFGHSLTAATRITVVQGPTITFYNLGDESSLPVNMTAMPIPFYGSNYTQLHLCSNGYLTFGSPNVDYTPTAGEMNSGPPRLAPFWTDLTCPANGVKATLDTNPGPGIPGYLTIEYTNAVGSYNPTVSHNFSMTMRTDGNVEIYSGANNNPSAYDSITGIGPGSNLGSPQTQKNFIGAQPFGSSVGPGILTTPPYAMLGTVNMSFFEWFGLVAQHAYYTNGYDNPFDIFATTITFAAAGTMPTLPAASNTYLAY